MTNDTALPQRSQPHPTRAEMRRARELEVERQARAEALAVGTRAERRRALEREQEGRRREWSVWAAWWLVPLTVGVALCVYLAVVSSHAVDVPNAPVVLTSNPPDE